MFIMQKSVSWASIVKLGCDLSDHCRPGSELREVFIAEGWCPQNSASFGERGSNFKGEWTKGEQGCQLLQKMKKDNFFLDEWGGEQEADQFLPSLLVWRDLTDRIWWRSRSSGTVIDCLKEGGKWIAEIREGYKPSSRYAEMWAEMTA